MSEWVNLVALRVRGHTYVVRYDDYSRPEAYEQVQRWAADADVPLTWADAAVIAQAMRRPASEASREGTDVH